MGRHGRSGDTGSVRDWFHQSGAFFVLLAILSSITVPGLSLAAKAAGVYVCHAAGTAPDGAAFPKPGTCCLICHAAHLADGAMASKAVAFPPPQQGRAGFQPVPCNNDGDGGLRRHAQARAPPPA